MLPINTSVKVIEGCQSSDIPSEILASNEPVILRGLVRDWPIVQAGLHSDQDADNYLRSFYDGKTVGAFLGAPEIAGRYFYNDDLSELNFENHRVRLDFVLDNIQQHKTDAHPPSFYVGSTTIDACLPGFREKNDVKIKNHEPLVSIWIGNKSRIACHYDAPDNLACTVVGKRRFTVFPPEQIANLYPGPIDFTPAGQAISLVDFSNPDYEKFPRFREAVTHGQIAELEPGDALFIPSMWWHHVESLSSLNVLVNYWWRTAPAYMGPAMNVLKHAMLSIRDLPEKEKAALKSLFEYYVFDSPERVVEEIPVHAQGVLAPMDELQARQLRAWLINKLNR